MEGQNYASSSNMYYVLHLHRTTVNYTLLHVGFIIVRMKTRKRTIAAVCMCSGDVHVHVQYTCTCNYICVIPPAVLTLMQDSLTG